MGLRTLVCIRGVREGCQLPVSDPHCQSMQWSTVASIASQRSMSPSLPSPYCTYVAPKHCLEKELINAAAIKSSLHWSSTDCSSRPTNTGDALRVNAAWKTRSARSALWCTGIHWGVHRIGGIGRVGVLATLELGGCPVLMHRRTIVIIAIIVIHHHLHLL